MGSRCFPSELSQRVVLNNCFSSLRTVLYIAAGVYLILPPAQHAYEVAETVSWEVCVVVFATDDTHLYSSILIPATPCLDEIKA